MHLEELLFITVQTQLSKLPLNSIIQTSINLNYPTTQLSKCFCLVVPASLDNQDCTLVQEFPLACTWHLGLLDKSPHQ